MRQFAMVLMPLIISENHTESELDVKRIVDRLVKYQQPEIIAGLNEIAILDNSREDIAFACYRKSECKIEIYLDPTVKCLPEILKKTYFFPFIVIAMVLAHELDHHVNRDNELIDKEQSAEENMLKYIYPALGIFKPMVRVVNLAFKRKISN